MKSTSSVSSKKIPVRDLSLRTPFSQDLYDQLPSVRSIEILLIAKAKKQTNFNFLGDFRQLYSVNLFHSRIPVRAIRRAFESAESAESFFDFHIYREDCNRTLRQNRLLSFSINFRFPSLVRKLIFSFLTWVSVDLTDSEV